jgi:DNA modification methylase
MKMIQVSSLKLNADNPRKIKTDKFEKLRRSVESFPKMMELRPIVVDEVGLVLGGNYRLRALIANGVKEIPEGWVKVAPDLTDAEKREFIAKDNANFGDWDWEVLANWNTNELTDWGIDVPAEEAAPAPMPDEYAGGKDKIPTTIVLGDLIEIAGHRLLCGDCTKRDQVERLLNGARADMVFTDPPYGVNHEGDKGKGNTIAGDLTQTAIPFSFELAVQMATKPEARFYFCGGEGNISLYFKLFERYLAQMPKLLVWVKNGFVMRPNGYHSGFELIFYGFKSGGGGKKHWYGGRTEVEASDVWKVSRDPSRTYVHSTQKPVELAARAIRVHSQAGDLVYEPFGGSGSTMAAAHVLGRKCYAMEIEPQYCQAHVNRMKILDPEAVITLNGKPYG